MCVCGGLCVFICLFLFVCVCVCLCLSAYVCLFTSLCVGVYASVYVWVTKLAANLHRVISAVKQSCFTSLLLQTAWPIYHVERAKQTNKQTNRQTDRQLNINRPVSL